MQESARVSVANGLDSEINNSFKVAIKGDKKGLKFDLSSLQSLCDLICPVFLLFRS